MLRNPAHWTFTVSSLIRLKKEPGDFLEPGRTLTMTTPHSGAHSHCHLQERRKKKKTIDFPGNLLFNSFPSLTTPLMNR